MSAAGIYLEDEQFEGKQLLWPFLKRIFNRARKHTVWFWGLVLSITGVAIVDAMLPFLLQYYIDVVVRESTTGTINPFVNFEWGSSVSDFILLYGGVIIFSTLLVAIFIYCAGMIMELVLFDLREAMFVKLQHLSFSYYDNAAMGWVVSRITSDANRVSELISWGFISLVWGVFMIIFCFSFMFYYSWKLALAVMVVLPMIWFVSVRIRMLILKYSRKARKLNSELTANFNENINGINVNKATAQEAAASGRFEVLSESMRSASFRSSYYSAMYIPIVVMVGSIAAALVIYMGGDMLSAGVAYLTPGILAAFFIYARNIFEPILDITRFYAMAQYSLAAGERIFGLIDTEEAIKDVEGAVSCDRFKGEIEIANVNFGYVPDKTVLSNFDLHIKPGESIALVGPTGEGKTTITNLIARFYEPTTGKIMIDGKDYMQYKLEDLRKNFGIILQTPHLFEGTVKSNIKYGKLDATDEEVKAALDLIGAQEFHDRLEEEVGEDGSQLSIGEKQIIAFARVILKDPAILIMDEATSSIDTLAETKIQKGINHLTKGRTSLIIAHRLSTIRSCDRILVIRNGGISEMGSHDELMKAGGYYHTLYTRQSTGAHSQG